MEGGWTTPFVPKVVVERAVGEEADELAAKLHHDDLAVWLDGDSAWALKAGFVGLIRAHSQVAEREVGLAIRRVSRQQEVSEPGLSGGDRSTLSVERDGFCRFGP